MNPALLELILKDGPGIIATLKDKFIKANPDQPQPTDAEVIAAWQDAKVMSLAKDDAFRAE